MRPQCPATSGVGRRGRTETRYYQHEYSKVSSQTSLKISIRLP